MSYLISWEYWDEYYGSVLPVFQWFVSFTSSLLLTMHYSTDVSYYAFLYLNAHMASYINPL